MNGQNCFEDICIQFKKTEVLIHCLLHMQEYKDESEISKYQWIHPLNIYKFMNEILGVGWKGMLDLAWL